MNETLKHIHSRYSCRRYSQDVPADSLLEAVAQAAITAPSSTNRQGWRVVLVTNRALMDEIEAEALHILQGWGDGSFYQRILDRGGSLFYGASAMIIVPIEQSDIAVSSLDCGIVCQTAALAATSLGLSNVICGLTSLAFAGEKGAYFMEQLQFPEGYRFGASILLGYAQEEGAPHTPDQNKIIRI